MRERRESSRCTTLRGRKGRACDLALLWHMVSFHNTLWPLRNHHNRRPRLRIRSLLFDAHGGYARDFTVDLSTNEILRMTFLHTEAGRHLTVGVMLVP